MENESLSKFKINNLSYHTSFQETDLNNVSKKFGLSNSR